MRRIVRKFTTQEQRIKLGISINKINTVATKTISFVVNMLPASAKVFLKSNLELIKRMDYDKEDIFLDISSPIEYRVRLHSCRKEPETVEWIQEFFKKGDVFYDIGANIGAYSLVAAKYCKGEISIYAFEPSFLNYAQLSKNIFINKCQACIVPLNIALSDKTAIGNFHHRNLVPGGALHSLGEAVDQNKNTFIPVFTQPVLSYTIDDLIKEFNIPLPNHIKLDVDGIEMSILKGAKEMFSHSSLRSILVEMNDDKNEIIDYLAKWGFHVSSPNLSGPTTNCIFLRN
ncbi:MAG: FkbM family methyltransferase [bacterium]|nr:FkbM family methyltransferase [bacterium]